VPSSSTTCSRSALARFLRSEGYENKRAQVLATRALSEAGSLMRMRAMSDAALSDLLALGGETTARLRAALELGEALHLPRRRALLVMGPSTVYRWARRRLLGLCFEELWLLALDAQSRFRAARCVARGGTNAVSVTVRDVLRVALSEGASAFVLVHNHPSGDPTPSTHDIAMTHAVGAGAATVGVPLVDHVVVATSGFRTIELSGWSGGRAGVLPAPAPASNPASAPELRRGHRVTSPR